MKIKVATMKINNQIDKPSRTKLRNRPLSLWNPVKVYSKSCSAFRVSLGVSGNQKPHTVPHVLQTRSMGLSDLLQRVVRCTMVLEVHLATFLSTERSQGPSYTLCVLCCRHLIKSLFWSCKTHQMAQISPRQKLCSSDLQTTTPKRPTEAIRAQTLQRVCCVYDKVNNKTV